RALSLDGVRDRRIRRIELPAEERERRDDEDGHDREDHRVLDERLTLLTLDRPAQGRRARKAWCGGFLERVDVVLPRGLKRGPPGAATACVGSTYRRFAARFIGGGASRSQPDGAIAACPVRKSLENGV